MDAKELREVVARELWYQFTKSNYGWPNLISTYKKAWYKRADIFIERAGLNSITDGK